MTRQTVEDTTWTSNFFKDSQRRVFLKKNQLTSLFVSIIPSRELLCRNFRTAFQQILFGNHQLENGG